MVRTLILEDSPTDLLLFEAALKEGGYTGEFLKASTSQSFIEQFSLMCDASMPEDLNIIFLDVLLNISDGLQILEKINSQLLFGQMVVYCFSGLINEKTIQNSYALGVNAYLFKPGNFPEMVDIIGKSMLFALRSKDYREVGINKANRIGPSRRMRYTQTLTNRNKNRSPLI